MNILRGFLPFILFWVLVRSAGIQLALWVSTATALFQLLGSVRQGGIGSVKLLDGCAVVLFAALAVVATFIDREVSPFAVRMSVDGALAVIAIGSMLIGKPFTLQYAREQVPPELWNSPLFIRTNYLITGVWSAAFVIQCLASAAVVAAPDIPPGLLVAVSLGALVGAIAFTVEYPKRVRVRAAASG